jgi:hypothetical protein
MCEVFETVIFQQQRNVTISEGKNHYGIQKFLYYECFSVSYNEFLS